MNKQTILFLAVGAGSLAIAAGAFFLGKADARPATPSTPPPPPASRIVHEEIMNEPILPIRPVQLDAKKVQLGRRLFLDTRLSGDNTISCNTCHNLATGGMDGKPRSIGINGSEGEVNAPTVFNCGLNFKQFWDGRADTLEEQIDGPTHNPKEMGSSWPQIVEKLSADPGLAKVFVASYPAGITAETIKDAIATFERSLTTPDSRFDRYLRGDSKALTDDEKMGYKLFKDLGCISCHQGMNAGGNMFQPFGVMADYFADRTETKADLGRYNVTGLPQDKHKFRVPGLRNVELTAPYFHDASAKTLEDAVRLMAEYQLGQPIDNDKIKLITAFLKTLTGEQPSP